MLLPLILNCGWCYYHIGVFNNSSWDLTDVNANAFFFVADGIAMYVEDVKPHFFVLCLAGVIAMVADGVAT